MATLLAEVYGPDAETRRAVATKLRHLQPRLLELLAEQGIPPAQLRIRVLQRDGGKAITAADALNGGFLKARRDLRA